MLFGLRVPGFIRIHLRYLFSNPFVWAVLFLAPFVIGLFTVSSFSRNVLQINLSEWQIFLIVLFLIALSFFFAERNRTFRKIYVRAIPAMVIINGIFVYIFDLDSLFGGLVVFAILAVLPGWILGKLSMGMGYRMLSNGADRHYRPGRDFYMEGAYDNAFLHLEPAARRGHMKSLYLIGHAHEHGNGRDKDRIRAARFYDKAAKKGYKKAQKAFETLCNTFSADELEAFENDLKVSGINDLF
ncbi:hypothetical protein GCM10007854_28880 [Algimonas porphyrae]|uniref:Sel1 repeat family protein n=1 Tax=Algimonas porphyrae TaxID=1128113 RepID=A0ABQ5V327_9PROT|nr:hypothetical protein GCM10007854_28880 [Algimonas porphyrae]